jgi:PEGA domain
MGRSGMLVPMGRRIACVLLAAVFALPQAWAQPGEPEPDIEMEPEPAGSGSGSGSGSATPTPTPPTGDGSAAPVAVTKDPKVAKKWQTAAQQLVAKGDYNTRKNKAEDAKLQYENALTAYAKAIEASDDPLLHYELGLVEDKLGKFDLAAVHMRTVVAAKTGVKPDILKKATAKYDELTTKVGLVTLTVNTEGATITLNGAEIGKSPITEPLIVMPGTYTLSFSADGYQPKDSEIKVEAGSESERAIELDPIKIVVEPIKNEPDGPITTTAPKPPSKLPIYVGGGAAVVFAGVGLVTGILAISAHSTFTAGDSKAVDRADAKSNGTTLAHVTDIMFAGALVAGGFTAYWYFFKYKPAQKKLTEGEQPIIRRDPNAPDISKVDVIPWVQPTAGGFSVAGSF